MNDLFEASPIRIPVQFVDGVWELLYGGPIPIKNGAFGELTVPSGTITDKDLLAWLKTASDHKVLEEGTELRVALTIKPGKLLLTRHKKHLVSMSDMQAALSNAFYSSVRSPDTQFVRIKVGPAKCEQGLLFPSLEAGVWLKIQGGRPKSISTSQIVVPADVSSIPLDSLNHAFTRLSEIYEPWRKSHTGNIYDRILYQETNGKWYPLRVLRNAALAKDENQLIRSRWAEIVKTLRLPTN